MKKYAALAVLLSVFVAGGACDTREKIGILYIDVGTPTQHEVDWAVGFFAGIADFFYPGWFAGGPLDGGTATYCGARGSYHNRSWRRPMTPRPPQDLLRLGSQSVGIRGDSPSEPPETGLGAPPLPGGYGRRP